MGQVRGRIRLRLSLVVMMMLMMGAVGLLRGEAAWGEEPLREAVRGRFRVGTAIGSRQLSDPKVASLVVREFDCLTGENEFKPTSVQPRAGVFRFEGPDRIVAFAKEHGLSVVGHTLCWHHQTPRWMFENAAGEALPRDEALRNLKQHIDTVVGHFKGQVIGWDVVNEAISDSDEPGSFLRETQARRALGEDYVATAYELALAADPGAELYYNDYGIEAPGKLERTIRLVRQLRSRGIPLAAVGIQGHFQLDDPGAIDRVDRAIGALGAEGVKVMLTEVDVDVLPRQAWGADVSAREQKGADPYRSGLPAEVAKAQAAFYGRLFEVVLKHPGVVTRVTLWGTHDGASWLNTWPVFGRTNHPLLWDRRLEPKPALRAVLGALDAP
jgi:endo-1,4-beta-xylanase